MIKTGITKYFNETLKDLYMYVWSKPLSVRGVSSHRFLRLLGVAPVPPAPGVSLPGVMAPGVA